MINVSINESISIEVVSNGVIVSGNYADNGDYVQSVFGFSDPSAKAQVIDIINGSKERSDQKVAEAISVIESVFEVEVVND